MHLSKQMSAKPSKCLCVFGMRFSSIHFLFEILFLFPIVAPSDIGGFDWGRLNALKTEVCQVVAGAVLHRPEL